MCVPTISGRASAAVEIRTPAPMVAASATAILVDINVPLAPNGSSNFTQNRQLPACPDVNRAC
jgi:hypothetical protein